MTKEGDLKLSIRTSLRENLVFSLHSKIREMLMGPIIMMAVIFSAGIIILTVAVPQLSFLLEKMDLTPLLTTKIVIAISRFFIQGWYWIFLILIGAFFLFKIVFKINRARKFLDRFCLRLPFIGRMVKKINTAYTVKKISLLTATGVSFAESLESAAGTAGNVYYKNALIAASGKVKNGCKISEAMRSCQDLYPLMLTQMLEVGEETGQLPRILEKLSAFFDDEILRDIKSLAVLAELVLIIIFGALAGFFAISAIQPLHQFIF